MDSQENGRSHRLLIINPGSTSTKISVFDDRKCMFTESVFHDAPQLLPYPTTNDQMPFRALGKVSGGRFSQDMCRSIVKMVNGRGLAFVIGMGGLIGGYLFQRKILKKAKKMK